MTRDMTRGNIFLHMLFYSVPLLIGNVFHQLYNTVDSVIVGSVNGKQALAAIGAAGPVMNILLFLIVGISMGSSILMSGYYGAGKFDLLKSQMMTSLLGSLVFTLFLSLFSVLGSGLFLKWIQTPEVLIVDAGAYLRIISAGLVFSCIYNMLAAGLRAVGNSTAPLSALVISSVVNILLDLFLVGRLGMGIRGAAIATVVSQAVSAVFLTVYIYIKVPFFRFTSREFTLEAAMLQKTVRFSSVSAVQQTVLYVGRILVQSAVNTLGVDAVAAFNVTCIIDNYVLEPGNSLASALTVFTAQNEGAGERQGRIARGFAAALCMGLVISAATALAVLNGMDGLIGLFLKQWDEGVAAVGRQYLQLMCFGYVMTVLCNSFQGLFRGLGQLKATLTATLIQIPVRVILSYCLIGRLGIRAVAVGIMTGWAFMIIYQVSQCRRTGALGKGVILRNLKNLY